MRSIPENNSQVLFWWSCEASDPDPKALCKTTLEHDPRVTVGVGGSELVVQSEALLPDQTYTFTVNRIDRRTALGIPAITYN